MSKKQIKTIKLYKSAEKALFCAGITTFNGAI